MPRCLRLAIPGALALLGLRAPDAAAWGPTGHRVVAAIAWQNMSAAVRGKVIAMLMTAPTNSAIRSLRPATGTTASRDERWFIEVAIWPDLIRQPGPSHVFHHSQWHFADHFWEVAGGQIHDVRGPASTNAVERLVALEKDLQKSTTGALPKAVELAWIVHLVGDIHQPLHSSARITAALAGGDSGGNAVHLTPKLSLHGYWDHIPDEVFEADPTIAKTFDQKKQFEQTPQYIQQWVSKITMAFPATIVATDPAKDAFDAWSRHGLALAQRDVYTGVQAGHFPDAAYRIKADKIAERAIAEAGYRLAAFLTMLVS